MIAAMDAALMPFPIEETTPPVTKINLVCLFLAGIRTPFLEINWLTLCVGRQILDPPPKACQSDIFSNLYLVVFTGTLG
jgi:hypothetical protein